MKVLVTGGAGYIGSHAVYTLLKNKYPVVAVDNLSRGYRQPIETLQKKYGRKNLKFYQADLRDFSALDKILKKEKPKAVMHFAALCLVNESMEKPEEYFDNNVCGSNSLLKAMAKNKINQIIFSSTCAIYGESQYLPMDEKHPKNPSNAYGESKLIVEKMLPWYDQIHQIRYVSLRYYNVCGAHPQGLFGDSKKPSQLLAQNAVRGALRIAPFQLTCPKVKTKDGTPIRDYVNVLDLAEAHLLALKYLKKKGQSESFNLGTGKGNSVLEIVNQVQEITGVKFKISKGETRKGEYAQVYADNRKIKKLLGWKPKRTIKDSVTSLVQWYKKHPQGWDY